MTTQTAQPRPNWVVELLIGLLSRLPSTGRDDGLPELRVLLSHRAIRKNLGATGWNSNAFAPIVRARPFPVFGRPVHHGLAPFDYGPVVLRMPFGFRLATDTLPSGWVTSRDFPWSANLGISCTVFSLFPMLCPLGFFLIY